MKERDEFEGWIKNKTEGASIKPPRSIWDDIKDDLPREESTSPNINIALLAIGMIFMGIVAIWFYNQYQQVEPKENLNIAMKAEHILRGEKLFNSGCATCHDRNMKDDWTGPALGGVTQRRSKEWLYAFTRNSQKMIASGDVDAIELWNDWGLVMNSFPYLTDEELSNIFSYIEHVNYNESPREKRSPEFQVVNGEKENFSGDSIFEIKIEGPVDSLLENGEFFHEEMELKEEGNF